MVCKTCGGHGIMVSEFCGETTNPSLCPDCLENGICPNCGSVNVEDYTDEFKMVGYRCLRCGWIWFDNGREWGF